jgi:hypothetical protein
MKDKDFLIYKKIGEVLNFLTEIEVKNLSNDKLLIKDLKKDLKAIRYILQD